MRLAATAEMAEMDFESFRLLLRDRAVPWEVEAESHAELDRSIAGFFGPPNG